MGTNTDTDTEDTNPEHELFEVVNEHNEVLHVFSPTIKPSHPQDNSLLRKIMTMNPLIYMTKSYQILNQNQLILHTIFFETALK